jgi:hypothetical protein
MTACIQPEAQFVAQLLRTNPEVRRRDYEEALRFWLALPEPGITGIVLIENSGADLAPLARMAESFNPFGRKCEFISAPGGPTPPGFHYGYAEFRMIDEGLAQSQIYRESAALIKATGRYRFPTISRLLRRLPADYAVAVDARHNRHFVPQPQFYITAPLLLARRDFFETHVRRIYQRMKPPPPWRGQFIEDLLWDELMPLAGQPGVILRWPVNCDPDGIGADGGPYNTARKRFLRLARSWGRRLTPYWWF